MEEPKDGFLEMWQGVPASSKPPTKVTGASKKPQGSTPRVEKGVVKVIDKNVKEKASKLLYALARGFQFRDAIVQENFMTHVAKDIDEVVSHFALDKKRMQDEGDKFAAQIIDEINHSHFMADFEKDFKGLGSVIETMKMEHQNDRENDSEHNVLADGDIRSTRGGNVRKRGRDIQDAEHILESMQGILKRLKGGDEGRRRQS